MLKNLQITAPEKTKHQAAIYDLTGKIFGNYYRWQDSCAEYFEHSGYDWQATRIGVLDDQVISHFGIWDYRVRYGSGKLKTAGIGAVATNANYRGKGVMRATIQSCLDGLSSQGYHLSVLFGIENFYDKFGYVPAWPEETWSIKRDQLPDAKPAVKLKKITKQWDDLDKLYNRLNKTIAGTVIRPFYTGRTIKGNHFGYYWGQKTIDGYVVGSKEDKAIRVTDQAGKPEEVLKVLKGIMLKEGYRTLEISGIPFHSPLCRSIRERNCWVKARYTRWGSAMVKTVSLRRSLEALQKELSARVSQAGIRRSASVSLQSKDENVTLSVANGVVQVSDERESKNLIDAGHHSARLLIGSEIPDEMIAMKDISVKGEGAFWASILFPCLRPTLPPSDHY